MKLLLVPAAFPRCLFPSPHSQLLPGHPDVPRGWFPGTKLVPTQSRDLLETFYVGFCISYLPPATSNGLGRFPPTPHTFHELSALPALRFQLGSGIELSHANVNMTLTNKEAAPEPGADPAEQQGLR